MGWRVAASPHAHQKFHLSETELFKQVCNMLPIYDRRPERLDYVFRSGDGRSTLDDRLMAKTSDIQEAALEVQENLLQKVKALHESGKPATREELLNAMLHLFLSVGVDEEEVGDLSLDKMPNSQLFRYGLGEDGPVPIYTSKTKYTALILNLGNFIRGRKKTAPSTFSDYIEYDSSGDSRGALIKSIAQSKSHLFMLCSTNISCACYGGIPGGNKGGYPEGITTQDCFSRSAVCPRSKGLEAASYEVDGWSYSRHP